jgi:hypothetical protein
VILSMRLRPHPESKPPSYHGSRESRRYRQRQKLLGQALSLLWKRVDRRRREVSSSNTTR